MLPKVPRLTSFFACPQALPLPSRKPPASEPANMFAAVSEKSRRERRNFMEESYQWRKKENLHPPLPGHQPAFDPAHQQVEEIGDDADHDDAHDDDVGAQEIGGVEHHLAETDAGRDHLGGDERRPAEADG